MTQRQATHWYAWIFAAALIPRLWIALQLPVTIQYPDGKVYWSMADRLLNQGEFAFGNQGRAIRTPAYPLFLAGVMALGGDPLVTVRVTQAVLGALTCCLLMVLAKRLFGDLASLTTGLIAAGYPLAIGTSGLVLTETWFGFCLVATFLVLPMPWHSEGSWKHWVLGGGLAGWTTLLRPSALLLWPLLVVLDVVSSSAPRKVVVRWTWVVVGFAVVLAPWTVRNAFVLGTFVPTTTRVGASLYDGLNPHATGASDYWFERSPEHAGVIQQPELDQDRYWRAAAWQYVRAHPWRCVHLAGRKLIRFWNPFPNAPEHRQGLRGWLIALTYVPTLVLALVGSWLVRSRWRHWGYLWLPILYFCALHMVFVSSIRYRLPGMLLLMPLAGMAVAKVCHRIRLPAVFPPSEGG